MKNNMRFLQEKHSCVNNRLIERVGSMRTHSKSRKDEFFEALREI